MVAAGSGVTVIWSTDETSVHPPEITFLLNQVVEFSAEGAYPTAVFVPLAAANPETAFVVLLSQR